MAPRAQALRGHGTARRLAPLLAIVAYLEARSIGDCLAALDLLMVTELLGKAETATDKERGRLTPVHILAMCLVWYPSASAITGAGAWRTSRRSAG